MTSIRLKFANKLSANDLFFPRIVVGKVVLFNLRYYASLIAHYTLIFKIYGCKYA